jgi:hypothetical protein
MTLTPHRGRPRRARWAGTRVEAVDANPGDGGVAKLKKEVRTP